jgi:uncharacterized protein (DUF3820 family)
MFKTYTPITLNLTSEMPWGKYKGYAIQYIIDTDIDYIEWLIKTVKVLLKFKKPFILYLKMQGIDIISQRELVKLPYSVS